MSDANAGTSPYFGFWMPSPGSNGIGAVEVFYVSASNAFEVVIETKSSDDDDGAVGAPIGNVTINNTVTIPGPPLIFKMEIAGAMDLIRYRVNTIAGTGEYVHLQFCQPLWSPN